MSSSEEALVKKEAARSAARREIYYFANQNSGLELLLGLLLLLCIAAPWMVRFLHAWPDSLFHLPWKLPALSRSGSAHGAANSTLTKVSKYLLIATGGALLLFVMYPYASPNRVRPLNIRRLLLVLVAAANSIAISLFLFTESGGIQGGNWRNAGTVSVRDVVILSCVLAASLAVFLLVFIPFVVVLSAIKGWLVRPILRRYDLLLLAMIDVCATTHRRRDTWFTDTARTEVARAIETAARTAEKAAPRPGLMAGTRHVVRNDALRLAAVIREHKKPILRASGPSSFDRVTESMWSGVVALIEDDWATLTAAAPPVTAATKLRRFASRIGPQTVLLGAAFAIPLIPAVAEAPAVASSVRVTLIVTAVLGLALPRESPARAPILDVLGKALPFKSEK
ncbi:hypothetical protein [Streptomyces auratus]|uniref:Uncharacterized protein n=1 Tax=Streptomyces auratus AGR0001 TaxID=1160718 RepID=A0A8B1NT22_9ACTN|nr:hypothetical protein [Streptomyces auratus]QTZ90731.1 hypothetical protein SU9_003990 [Streptomyces auratus AGR0001]